MSKVREIQEGLQFQGEIEEIYYTLDTENQGGSPSATSAKIFENDEGVYTDVTDTKMDGSTSVSGDVITLPQIKSLVDGQLYRVEVLFTSAGQKLEPGADLQGER